jgi:arabinofuranosyltransferase
MAEATSRAAAPGILVRSSRVFREATLVDWALGVLLLALIVRCAWLCDDAYITLRVSDNLAEGHGATFNPGARVQAYTNPLWMLVLAVLLPLVNEPYVTLMAASLVTSLFFVVLFVRGHAAPGSAGALGLIALAGSKSFVDYSTSGLENPLAHVLVAWGFASLWNRPADLGRLRRFALAAGLGACTRMDLGLLFLPALIAEAVARWRDHSLLRVLGALALGLAPFAAWEVFSLVYYGELVPNTAYAKLATDIPLAEYARQGWYYLRSTAVTDPAGILAIGLALVLGLGSQRSMLASASAGLLLSLAYLFRVGGDFMVGRSFTPSIVLAACMLARVELGQRSAWPRRAFATVLLAAAILAPLAPWKAGPGYDSSRVASLGAFRPDVGILDERGIYFPVTGLLRTERSRWNDHPWVRQGEGLRAAAEQAPLGPSFAAGTGMTGFHAGPRVQLLDQNGLADPVLARLPMPAGEPWRIGHFARPLPAGYHETLATGIDHLRDPDLAGYYGLLERVTRGELWSTARLAAIWRLHFGATRARFEDYRERFARREVELEPMQ